MNTLLIAARPKTLIASLSPMCLGTAMAFSEGHFTLWVFLLTFLTGLGIQISTNVANDLFDFLKGADTEMRKGPTRVAQSGLLSVPQVKKLTLVVVGATAFCGALLIFRGGLLILPMLGFALLLAVAYTAGPFPLAYLGIAEFFILIFFGPVACGFTYFLQTLHFKTEAFLIGFGPGMISCSLLVVNNLRDIAEDRIANKKTLVARFGTRFGKIEFSFFIFAACLLPLFVKKYDPVLFLSFIPAIFLVREVVKNQDPFRYNPLLGKTGNLLTLYTFIVALSFCL